MLIEINNEKCVADCKNDLVLVFGSDADYRKFRNFWKESLGREPIIEPFGDRRCHELRESGDEHIIILKSIYSI